MRKPSKAQWFVLQALTFTNLPVKVNYRYGSRGIGGKRVSIEDVWISPSTLESMIRRGWIYKTAEYWFMDDSRPLAVVGREYKLTPYGVEVYEEHKGNPKLKKQRPGPRGLPAIGTMAGEDKYHHRTETRKERNRDRHR